MSRPDDQDFRQGRRRLRELLPTCRAEIGSMVLSQDQTPLMSHTMAFVTEDNLDALVLYPAKLGGWHADLKLKKVPPGTPNSLGSPVAQPYPSRSAAEAGAKALLVMMLTEMKARRERKARRTGPMFLLYNVAYEVPHSIVVAAEEFRARGGEPGMASPTLAAMSLEGLLDRLLPGHGWDLTIEDLAKLSDAQRVELFARLCTALMSHLYAFPEREAKPPTSTDGLSRRVGGDGHAARDGE